MLTLAVIIFYSVLTVPGRAQSYCHSDVISEGSSLTSKLQQLVASGSNCSTLQINPGCYTVEEVVTLDNISVSIYGVGSVRVTFPIADEETDFYFLRFRCSDEVTISGIQFERSAGIIGFEQVNSVFIENSTFRWFAQGALDVFQSFQVTVVDSLFEHNGPVYKLRDNQYRGYAAGLSVGYNKDQANSAAGNLLTNPRVSVLNCTFRNNTSDPRSNPNNASSIRPNRPHEVFRGFVFTGRGGGIAINVNSTVPFHVFIEDCLIEGNKAQAFGGGLYLLFSAYAQHRMEMTGTRIIDNESRNGGGMSLAVLEGESGSLEWRIEDTHFENNLASSLGGGIFCHVGRAVTSIEDPSTILTIRNSFFTRNLANSSGAALSLSSQLLQESIRTIPLIEFEGCNFRENDGMSGGVLTAGHTPLVFKGSNYFIGNRGRVLVVIGSVVHMGGLVLFKNNSGGVFNGGAVYTSSFSTLLLEWGANVSFVENTGVTGAGLVVGNMAALFLPPAYRYTQFNPLCVFQYPERFVSPSDWRNVSVSFSNNTARTGSAILMNGIDLCSYPHFQMLDQVFRWNFIEFGNNTNVAHGTGSASAAWFVETLPQSVEVDKNNSLLKTYPGEKIKVSFKGIDELGRPTSSVIRLSNYSTLFNPTVGVSQLISNSSLEAEVRVISATPIKNSMKIKVNVESLFAEISSTDSFEMEVLPCPIGFEEHRYSNSTSNKAHLVVCRCASESNPNIRNCAGNQILLNDGLWAIGYRDNKTGGFSLGIHWCPGGYCRCFQTTLFRGSCVYILNTDDPDLQCNCNREGILCGSCGNGTGLSLLLNRCQDCTYIHIVSIIALIVADVVVIAVLLTLKNGPPGWCYTVLFYAEIMPYLSEGIHHSFYLVQSFGYYVGSGLSLYLVYDFCIPGINTEMAYFLRYIPFIITVIVGTVLTVFRKYHKMSRIYWFGFWWLTVLQYSHVVHTSMVVLKCPWLPDQKGHMAARWYVNANIECFTGFHLALSFLAMTALAFCVILIPIVLLYILQYLKRPLMLQNMILPISVNFKNSVPFWPAIELLRRLVLVFLVVVSPQSYPAVTFLGFSLLIYMLVMPYKKSLVNYLDTFLTVNMFLFLILPYVDLQDLVTPTSQIRGHHFNLTCGQDERLETITKILLPFYYFPYLVLLLAATTAGILALTQKMKSRRRKVSTGLRQYESFYRLSPQDAGVTTHVMEDLPQDAVPLSALQATHNLSTSQVGEGLPARYKRKGQGQGRSSSKFSRKARTTMKEYKKYLKDSIRFPKRPTHKLDSPKKSRKTSENPLSITNNEDSQ